MLDSEGAPATEEPRYWLPQQLDVLKHEAGGPYREEIPTPGLHVRVSFEGRSELVPVSNMIVQYLVGEVSDQTVVDGQKLVLAILQDVEAARLEHVVRYKGS